ncbi:MAG: fibronectin type III domain-containing protein [Bacteroidales bacterium]|nr:fibronectin type III domain-containing protein [Bacteroidales bacterium]
MKKFYIFAVMCLAILLGFAPKAQAQTVWDGTIDLTWFDADQSSFDISTPEQLAGVAQLVNNGITTFNGKTLNLTNDIWLNSTGDSTNNWVPIGGSATATGESPTSGYTFKGAFNGHGHIIYNLYCEKSSYFHAGLFGSIQNPCTIDSLVMINPVLKSQGMMGAIAGLTRSGGVIYIRHCLVINGRMHGTGGNNIGFMVGANYSNTSGTQIQNCGATGVITGNYPGGLGGNGQYATFTNCYFAGTLTGSPSGGMAAHSGSFNNCYSYSNITSGNQSGTIVSQADMQSAQMITNLGSAFMMDNGINNGYPIMSYMAGVDPMSAEICTGESVTLTAFGYDSYAWSNGATTASITVSPTTTTTYTVTGSYTAGGSSTHDVVVTVFPQAVVTAEVVASADGQTHATLNQSSFTLACGSSDNINLVVTPDINYRVSRVTLNGVEVYGDIFGEGTATITINPGGTLGEVKVFLSDTYTITSTIMENTGSPLTLSNLVQPYGNNGVYTVNAGNDQTMTFNNTARWILTDVEIDNVSMGPITSYTFSNVHENHTILATYVDSCGIFVLPFFEDFQSVSSGLPECYARNNNSSYPYVSSTYAYNGGYSLYSYNYTYGENAAEVPCLILPKIGDQLNVSELMVQFMARANSAAGYFVVGVMTDPADMSTFTALQTIVPLDGNGNWNQYTAYLGDYQGTGQYIAIKMPVTAYCVLNVDNVIVNYAPQCSPVTNLQTSNVYGTNVTVSWDPTTVGTPDQYNIEVTDNANQSTVTYTTTETTYTIMGLTELTSYTVAVYTSCTNGQTSDTTYVSFMTPCNSPVNVTVGSGTATTSYFPTNSCWNYAYSQQIIPASALGSDPANFASLFFQCSSVESSTRNWDIYAAMVPNGTNLSAGWIVPSSTITFQLIHSGNVTISSTGAGNWFEITLDTVLAYNGTSDLLLTFVDKTGSYSCSNYYMYHSDATTSNMSRYAYNDYNQYDYNNPGSVADGSVSDYVNNIRFSYCDQSTCIRPNTLVASNVTENSADVTWVSAGSESSWEVEYKASTDTAWTSMGSVSSTNYSFSGLDANTQYTVRVRALCSGSDVSLWSEPVTFRTECGPITTLPYSEDFEDASSIYSTTQDNYILCWSRYASDPSHFVYIPSNSYAHSGTHFLDFHHTNNCFNIAIMPALDASISVNTLQAHFYACKSGTSGTLEVGVMTDYADYTTFEPMDTIDLSSYSTYAYGEFVVPFDNYSGSGQYIAFRVSNAISCGYYVDDVTIEEIPTCMYPSNLHVASVGSDQVSVAWTPAGSESAWNVLYGVSGFNPETEGTSVAADSAAATITGLQTITTYDFYVQSDCGGLQSSWIGPVSATTGLYTMSATGSDTMTTCGVIIYDDGGANGNYSNYANSTLVLYPATPGTMMMITGTASMESNYDHLYIYDGVGTSGTQLLHVSGTNNNISVISTTGPLTINYTADYTVNYAGFALTAQCVSCFPPAGIAASNITIDGATVSWSGSAAGYSVYVVASDTAYYSTTDTFVNVSNLMPATTYQVYVRAICSDDSSVFSPSYAFNTACGAITVTATEPWTENFEGYAGGGAQSFVCWATPVTQVVDNGTSPFVYCGHSPSCHSGANSAELKGTSVMVALPEFTNDIHDLRLSFWATTTNTSNPGTVEIGVITDISDPTTFEVLGPAGTPGPRGSGSSSGNGNYMGPFDFNSVTATTGRIAIRLTNGSSSLSWNLDDFTVELAPSCPSPVKTSVTASNIGGHTATITFTDNDASHNSWTVYYKPSTDSVWTSVITSTQSVDLTNLDPETTYDVYVVTNCTTTDPVEDATQTAHFTTTVACPAPTGLTVSNVGMTTATLSWQGTADSYNITCGTDNLTSTTNSIDLTGLTAGTSYTVTVQSDCGTEGTSSVATYTFTTALCDVTDQCTYTFNLSDGYGDGWNGASITVQQNGNTVATIGMTGGSSATETVTLCDNQSTTLSWNVGYYDDECSFSVVGPDGTAIYTSSGTPSGTLTTFTTDCSGSGPATCDVPTGLAVAAASITQTTATATWTAGGTETAWNVAYKPVASTNWQTAIVSATTYPMSNLTPNTQYEIRVQANCGDNVTSDWTTSVTFTTLDNETPTCPAPTNLTATIDATSHTTVTLTWQQEANTASEWQINYRQTTESTWSTATVTSTSYTLTDLVPNVDYEANVVAHCTNGLTSDPSNTVTWHTDDVGIVGYLEKAVNLYPNPATETISVEVSDANIMITGVEVYNVYGQLINTIVSTENPLRINISGLADGMYYVRVTTDGGVVTKNFVKK